MQHQKDEITKNPQYILMLPTWEKQRICYAGEVAVKEAGALFLPKTESQELDNNRGISRYNKYKARAVFYEYLSDVITAMLGVMQSEDTVIETPARIELIKTDATLEGESLPAVYRVGLFNQLLYGRFGMLLDLAGNESNITPHIVYYNTQKIVDWSLIDGVLKFVILDETTTEFDKDEKEWVKVVQFRIIALDIAGVYYSTTVNAQQYHDFDFDNPNAEVIYPELAGKRLNEIPFVFINATNILSDVQKPPLTGLTDTSLAIYRGEADYRHELFMNAQATLFTKGLSSKGDIHIGAGAAINAKNTEADAKWLELSGNGLTEMRESQNGLHAKAISMGISLFEGATESGAALTTRLSVKTANMAEIAKTNAAGFKKLLDIAAEWVGASIDEVVITPNLDFTSSTVMAQELVALWNAILQGAPLSHKSFHEYLRKNDFTELDWEVEQEEIELQKDIITNVGTGI